MQPRRIHTVDASGRVQLHNVVQEIALGNEPILWLVRVVLDWCLIRCFTQAVIVSLSVFFRPRGHISLGDRRASA